MLQSEKFMTKLFNGIVPAIVTPFDKNLDLNLKAIPKLVAHTLKEDISGIFVCGATGEAPVLTTIERKLMAEAVIKEVSGKVPIMVHVGATDSASSVELAKHAQGVGASAISSLPVIENMGNIDLAVKLYKEISKSAADLPFYVYWRREMNTKTNSPEKFIDLMQQVPNLVGLKFIDSDLYFLQRLIDLSHGKLNCLFGIDEMYLAGLAMGVDGAVGSTFNIMPRNFIQIKKFFVAGNIKNAMKKQYESNELITLLLKYGVTPGIKAILTHSGIMVGKVRPNNMLNPATIITRKQLNKFQGVINRYNIK